MTDSAEPLGVLLRRMMRGDATIEQVQSALRGARLDLAMNVDGRPLVVRSFDDEPCVTVATTAEGARVPSPPSGAGSRRSSWPNCCRTASTSWSTRTAPSRYGWPPRSSGTRPVRGRGHGRMSDDEFVFLLDPEWPAGDDAPPFEAVLGVWQVGDDGEVGEFRRNPDYRRHFPDSPATRSTPCCAWSRPVRRSRRTCGRCCTRPPCTWR
ncbi:hypothetical protein V2I01_32270 [Micromonospora sp. BRA006-A]|nr:hypothetical protein [Micromonospora sp. BRA006-A]